ncbi:MAG: hypothetical protein V4858_13150 [Pseudomonadota bacterium]
MTKLLFVVSLAISGLASSAATACDCVIQRLSEQYGSAHTVFLGEVVSVKNTVWETPKFFMRMGTQETKVRVLEAFKGELPSEVIVNGDLDYTTCSVSFTGPGEIRLIFLNSEGSIGERCGATQTVHPGVNLEYHQKIFEELRLLRSSQLKSSQYSR